MKFPIDRSGVYLQVILWGRELPQMSMYLVCGSFFLIWTLPGQRISPLPGSCCFNRHARLCFPLLPGTLPGQRISTLPGSCCCFNRRVQPCLPLYLKLCPNSVCPRSRGAAAALIGAFCRAFHFTKHPAQTAYIHAPRDQRIFGI